MATKQRSLFISLGIILGSLGLTYIPLPGSTKTVVVVSGTELQEPLQSLEAKFEREYPNIKLELKFQGSQDIVNKFIDDKNDFQPAVLIPANGELLKELSDRWQAQNNSPAFYEQPQPIAKTILVGIAWPERGKVLFPDSKFSWQRLETAMTAGNWKSIGGVPAWGSFDFLTTDPTRSNSGQLTMNLWALSKTGSSDINALNQPAIANLFSLVKRSVYQPPRSTDTLLQEFITRGANEADVATVYESIALHRYQQAGTSQDKSYQIYYLNPTVESTSTAAIVRRRIDSDTAAAAKQLIEFLAKPEQQATFVQYGFRPVNKSVDLKAVPQSPWNQNIPGAEVNPPSQLVPPPEGKAIAEIQRLWERAK